MTREAAGEGAQLVIWPESSTPFPFMDDQVGGEKIRALVRETGIELLLGSDQIDANKSYYNAAFLVRKDGSVAGVYQKMHLVPFGEFVPLQQLLFFVGPLVEQVGGFTPGRDMVMLPTTSRTDQHGHLLRDRLPAPGARIGAAGQPAADDDYQRCVVRPFVGAVSTFPAGADAGDRAGPLSGAGGQYRDQRHSSIRTGGCIQQSEIFEREILVGDVRMLESRTIYGRIGDLFAYICAGADAGRAGFLWRHSVAIALDDLTRRYQDLVKRAADLRSYL